MKITATKIKRELIENYGYYSETLESDANKRLINSVISDTLKIVDKILIAQKRISIK